MKNRELSKFFLCFKPVTSDERAVKPALSEDESGREKKKVRRSYSRAVKAVVFEMSLMKKLLGKKSRKNSFRSNSDLSSKNEKTVEKSVSYKDSLNCKEIFRTNSSHSSLFSSNPSSRSTSISSNSFASSINSSQSRSLSQIKRSSSFDYENLNINKQKGFNESYAGICIFLVSLFSLVILGKVFAILTCTSSCLFFGPRLRVESPVKDIYTDVQKKRVIMEGMLERNRSKVLLP